MQSKPTSAINLTEAASRHMLCGLVPMGSFKKIGDRQDSTNG